jgi:proteasome lid subunit RPN8/RPN11
VAYEIDPEEHIAVRKSLRTRGSSVLGAYHSHPRSPRHTTTRNSCTSSCRWSGSPPTSVPTSSKKANSSKRYSRPSPSDRYRHRRGRQAGP